MTPARFELLYVLGRASLGGELPAVVDEAQPMMQSRLRAALGVSRTTVSRMLRVLEKLGLVVRKACPHDTRTRLVSLTALGLFRLAQVLNKKIGPTLFDSRFCNALIEQGGRDWREEWRDTFDGRAARRARRLVGDLRNLARAVGDFATIWRWREYLDDPSRELRADDDLRRAALGEELAKATAFCD